MNTSHFKQHTILLNNGQEVDYAMARLHFHALGKTVISRSE